MKDKRYEATTEIGEENLKKLDDAGLVVVSRSERDTIQSQIDSLTTEIAQLKEQLKDDKSTLINKISALLEVNEVDIYSKIMQLQQALRAFAILPNKVIPDYMLIVNAKNALGDKVTTNVEAVKDRTRASVYIPPKSSISTNKALGQQIRRPTKKSINIVIKKPK